MAEKSRPRPQLQHDPLPVTINWANLRTQTAPKWSQPTPSSIGATAPNPPPFSPAAPLQPFHSQVKISPTKPLKSPIENNVDWQSTKGPQFVTLHQDFNEKVSQTYEDVSGSSMWEVCQDQAPRCLDFIKERAKEKQVFLICSGSLGQTFVPQIHQLPNVYAIYVYCINLTMHEQWAQNYPKVRLVCNSDTEVLFPQLAFDSAYFYYRWACALVEIGDKTKAKTKLEKASNIVKNHTKGRHDKEWEVKIDAKLKECG